MLHRRVSGKVPHGRPARPQTLAAARWSAFGLVLAAGLVLVGVSPGHNLPDTPLTSHAHPVHAVHPGHGHAGQTGNESATVSWVPTLRELANPALAPPEVAVHRHSLAAHERAEHVNIKLSPRQLSLAKW